VAAVVLTIAAISFIGIRHIVYTTVDNSLTAQANSAIDSAEKSLVMTPGAFYGPPRWWSKREFGQGDVLPATPMCWPSPVGAAVPSS